MKRLTALCAILASSACGSQAVKSDEPTSGTNTCPAVSGTGTTHATAPTANETWAAADNPHWVPSDLTVPVGVRLTLEPCADVRMGAGTHLHVEGEVVAEGTAAMPIRIAAADPSQPFGAIQVWAPGTLSLAHASVANGGADTTNSFGAVEARGDQALPAQEILRVNTVAVTGAVAFGVSLRSGAAFTQDSASLTVSGSGNAPVRILPRLLTNLPTGKYTGNAIDAVVVETVAYGEVTLEDVVVRDRGVPYHVGGDLTFGDFKVGTGMTPVKLTIEPGVVMKFKKHEAAGLLLDTGSQVSPANATLVALGTAEKPIVFTSQEASPAAGDWLGLSFGKQPSAQNALDFTEIRYAGGRSFANSFHCQPDGNFSADEDAALTLYGQPAAAFVTHTTFADSAGLGVNLAYHGSYVDFLPTNTFTNIADCKVSTPRTPDGPCPKSVSCP